MQQLNNQDKKKLNGILNKLQGEAPDSFDYEAVGQFKKAISQNADNLDISLNKNGESLLHIAASSEVATKDDINFLMSKAGMSPDRRNNFAYTPLDNALESYSSRLKNTEKNKRASTDHALVDVFIERSSLETIKKPSNNESTLFHVLSEIPSADNKLYKAAMDKLEGESSDERLGILNSKNNKGQTVLDRLMLKGNTQAIETIYYSLSEKEQAAFIIKGVNSDLFGDFTEDTYKFYLEKYKQVADYPVRYTEVPKKDDKVTFEPDEAKALADVLQRSLEANKHTNGYGSEEKVNGMISELQQTNSLKDGVNQTLGYDLAGTTLLNMTIGMHDKKSFDILNKYGADFNNREANQAKVLPIELAIHSHARTRSQKDRYQYKKASKAMLDETIEKSTIDSLVNTRTALEKKPLHYSNELVLFMPQFVFTGSALNLVAEKDNGSVLPEFVTKIIDKVNESPKITRIAEYMALTDYDGNSPLHSAASNGSKDILKEILNYKDLTPTSRVMLLEQQNHKGETPIDSARDYPETRKFLENQLKINKKSVEKEASATLAKKSDESEKPRSKKSKKNKRNKNNYENLSTKQAEVVQTPEKEAPAPVSTITPEPDLEDLVSQVYALLKESNKGKFPKKDFDKQKDAINKYILKKEGGNFEALDEALSEEQTYGGKSYRYKIKEELNKFSDDKKAGKVRDWADGISGRPNPSLKKDALARPDSVQDYTIETDSFTQPHSDNTDSRSVVSKNNTDISAQFDTLSIKSDGKKTPLIEEPTKQIRQEEQESKAPVVEVTVNNDNTDSRSVASKNNTDISVQLDASSTKSEGKKTPLIEEPAKQVQKEESESKAPVVEVTVNNDKKDSMSTLTTQQYEAPQQNDEPKIRINSERSAFKTITPVQRDTEVQNTAYVQPAQEYAQQPFVPPQNYIPANDGYAENFIPQQMQGFQPQFVQYPPAPAGQYNEPAYQFGYWEQPQQGFVAPEGYYPPPQQMGFAAQQFPVQNMQAQMPPQYAPVPQPVYNYNEAFNQNNGYYEQQYYQQQYGQFTQYPVDYGVNQDAYMQPQPFVANAEKQYPDNEARIAALHADRIALQKAQAALDEEIYRISGENSRSSGSVSDRTRQVKSVTDIVQEGPKSATEHAEKRAFARGRT